jgi:hypothetical protein
MLSEHFAQTLLNLEMVQLAESVKQVKAMRSSTNETRKIPVYFQQLRTRFQQRIARGGNSDKKLSALSQLERDDIIFAGKEFLLSFDSCV